MEEVKINLPKLGESILSATVVQWFKKVGDHVQLDEPLLEVSTDKVNSEIPSPVSGVLKAILAGPDEELQVGEALAIISTAAGAHAEPAPSISHPAQTASSDMKDFFSPGLLRLAKEKGISLEELEKIPGTGDGGRLTKKDLEAHCEKRHGHSKPSCPAMPRTSLPAGDVERVKMTGMRKAIADNMVRSFYEAPHASLITEVDITDILKLIQNKKEEFLAKHQAKLTITSFVVKAITKALQEFPFINSSLEEDTIVLKRYVNLGIAVSVEQGLMVPVIKNCQSMGISSLAKAISDLSNKARSNKLTPDDITGGTISLTNFGMSGVLIGVPIIRYPEVAIVGVGAIHKKVVPMENDVLAVRSFMHISLTFDHRVLDGMYGCGFLGALKKHIEADLNIE